MKLRRVRCVWHVANSPQALRLRGHTLVRRSLQDIATRQNYWVLVDVQWRVLIFFFMKTRQVVASSSTDFNAARVERRPTCSSIRHPTEKKSRSSSCTTAIRNSRRSSRRNSGNVACAPPSAKASPNLQHIRRQLASSCFRRLAGASRRSNDARCDRANGHPQRSPALDRFPARASLFTLDRTLQL